MPTDGIRDASDAMLVVAIGRYRQEALAEAYRRHAGAVLVLIHALEQLLVEPSRVREPRTRGVEEPGGADHRPGGRPLPERARIHQSSPNW